MNNILLFIAVIPSILLGLYIYNKDKNGKEPFQLLLSLVLGGVGAILITLFISTVIGFIFPEFTDDLYSNELQLIIGVFLGVGLVEEFSKWIILKLRTWNNKEFDHIFDGIVYAVFVTLGFATLENILYVFQFGSLGTALLRAIVSVPGHVFDAILMGTFYGEAKKNKLENNRGKMVFNLVLSIIIPMICHGFFDYLIYINTTISTIIFIVYVIILYIISFIVVNKVSKVKYNFLDLQCPYCGEIGDGNFCIKCGNKLK